MNANCIKNLKTLISCCLVSLFSPCILYHIGRLRNSQSNRKQNINNRFKLKPLKFNMFCCIFYDDAKESCNATLGHTHSGITFVSYFLCDKCNIIFNFIWLKSKTRSHISWSVAHKYWCACGVEMRLVVSNIAALFICINTLYHVTLLHNTITVQWLGWQGKNSSRADFFFPANWFFRAYDLEQVRTLCM